MKTKDNDNFDQLGIIGPDDEPEPCWLCDGEGVTKFCPSWPDQCRGCEEGICPECEGTGIHQ